jgi:FkbM family methyltransferase
MSPADAAAPPALSFRARVTWLAHLYKACARQHHRELIPLLRPWIPADAVVLDVGAHAGQFAKLFARLAPRGRVLAVEPGGYALSILRPALRVNRLRHVEVHGVGLGAAPGELTLTMPVKRSGSMGFGLSHFGSGPGVTQRVPVTTIDRLLAGTGRLDFLKADIEGWELQMLRGAAATLDRLRPVLWLEVVDAHLARAGDSAAALFDFLAAHGYRAHQPDGRPRPGLADGDILFLPAERSPASEGR